MSHDVGVVYLALLSCSEGSSDLNGPSEGHRRTEGGHSSLSLDYLNRRKIKLMKDLGVRQFRQGQSFIYGNYTITHLAIHNLTNLCQQLQI